MSAIIKQSRATLATRLDKEVLQRCIDPDEAIKILTCYLIRAGVITEITLATATE